MVVELDVAWGDMDSYGHVNNVVYFRYFESARIAYLDRIGWMEAKPASGIGPIMASTEARYRKPLAFPDHIWIGARLRDQQEDRITIEHAIASEKWNSIATTGNVVVVSFDYQQGRKVPIPEAIGTAIAALEARK